jgi:integrase
MGHGSGVRIVSAKSVEITFQYKGERCREPVRLTDTKTEKTLDRARQLKAAVDQAISLGTFDYLATFPKSKRALRLAKNPGRAILFSVVLDEYLESRRNNLRPPQWRDYSEYVRLTWKPYILERTVAEIDLNFIQTWVDEQTVGIKRIRALLSPVRQALKYAKRKEYIEGDPLDGLKVERPKVMAWTPLLLTASIVPK